MIDLTTIRHVADIPREQARRRGDDIALLFEGRTTTYAALDTRSNQVANGLRTAGAKVQDRIGYLGKNMDIYYEILFGAAKARMAMTGINWRLAKEELKFIICDAEITVLFVGQDFHYVIAEIMNECPSLRMIISLDESWGAWPAYRDWRASQIAIDPQLQVQSDDDVVQLYTSGTTGLPKGVQLTDANYMGLFVQAAELEWSTYNPREAVMNAMPLFHVAGVNIGILAILQGGKTVVLRDIDPTVILDLVEQEKIAHAFWVPAVILMLTQQPGVENRDFSSLKQVFYGASPIAEELLRKAVKLMDARFTQLYGLTETLGAATFLPPEAHDPAWGKLRSCGVPYPGAVVRCVDPEGKEVPTGQVGEIVVLSDFVMKGYWNRPEATEEALEGGFFHTGDAGYFDEDGFLYIHDRLKDMIVSGGENVYPAEVENAIFGCPGVADVAVIGVPDETWGEAIKAIVVPHPGEAPSPEDIITWTKSRIAGYKAPKSVDFADVLPRNPSGKVLRRSLREPYWEGVDRQVS